MSGRTCSLAVNWIAFVLGAAVSVRADSPSPKSAAELFRRDKLIAWCIVPFDARHRTPDERASMLVRLGLKHFAYDYRQEHVPSFEREIEACGRHDIALDAWWFPSTLNGEARQILAMCKEHGIAPQLWVSGGGGPVKSAEEQRQRLAQEVARLRPIAEAAAAQGMKVGLYNHGGWFGEPENQLAIIAALGMPNVGIVYNLHHGHSHVARLPEILAKIRPHLLALNLNGMAGEGDTAGRKILPLGQGELDLQVLRVIVDSGYPGPFGILGHTSDDAQNRLEDNLDGLAWLARQLDGAPAAPKPTPRTPFPRPPQIPARGSAPMPSAGPHLKPVDARYQVTLIDRSPDDVYLGVNVDAAGALFVGGREALFVFDPKPDGAFRPRRELLRFPSDSIIMGIEFRGDDLYVLTVNALYLVPGGRIKRTGLVPERILWGLPLDLHVSFHCLAWGPDGDLYMTHGDPLLQYGDWSRPDHWGHWTLYCGKGQTPVPFTGQGAVLAVKPDGTGLRVIAGGLRGPVGLAFDDRGHLFTNDNDHESRADQYAPTRLLHVLPGIDFRWPRGWMASKSPDRFDLIETMSDELGRGVPCGMVYYPRGPLGGLADRLVMCRWDRHAVTAYRLVPRGVSFSAEEETVLEGNENARPVGIATDRQGRLLVTSLYMTGNMAAPACPSDLVMVSLRPGEAAAPVADSQAEPTAATTNLLDDARSTDTYRRQLAVRQLAEQRSADELHEMLRAADEPTRLAGVLAIGQRLTVPPVDYVPPEKLKLFYPEENSFFKRRQKFYGSDAAIDPADRGRVGSFTTAQWWAAIDRTSEQQQLFVWLVGALNDRSTRVQLQAAYFLELLRDSHSEPLVAHTRSSIRFDALKELTPHPIDRMWAIGPIFEADDAWSRPAPAEQGPPDLSASWQGLQWREVKSGDALTSDSPGSQSGFFYFRVHSATRQPAMISTENNGAMRLSHNGSPAARMPAGSTGAWLVDLQPGSNDFVYRVRTGDGHFPVAARLELRAPAEVSLRLPDRLDSAMLSERLREASASTSGQKIGPEFLKVDWTRAATGGDPQQGRRLFGALACAKCHAIAPDQKLAGAPSLVDARRRFTVAHLVESVLLPSRQVAEPFRAQNFILDDGRVLTGLVVGETADAVELLLPDATRRTVAKSEIDQRASTEISPMPQGLVKTPDELRHLLAYLTSERPLPP